MSVASKWISRERFYIANIISATVLRGMWLTRNDFVLKNQVWIDVKLVLRRVLTLSLEWKPICKTSRLEEMKNWCSFLETKTIAPLQLTGT
jgi:hypothetical protein